MLSKQKARRIAHRIVYDCVVNSGILHVGEEWSGAERDLVEAELDAIVAELKKKSQ